MVGRKSERSRKSVKYSKYSADESEDDDFAEPTPPRNKKTKKLDKSKVENNNAKTVNTERKSRNRLSEEDKYQQELEAALQMSLTTTDKKNLEESQDAETTNSETNLTPVQDSKPTCTVQADVLPSPNSKLLMKNSSNIDNEKRKVIINEATSNREDIIMDDPVKENDNNERSKSGRSRKMMKEKEDENEYKMSDESESEDEISSPEVSSDESDYEETPKKKTKLKKQIVTSAKKTKGSVKCDKNSSANTESCKSKKQSDIGKENKSLSPKQTTPSAVKIQSSNKLILSKISTNPLPKTPKSLTFMTKRTPVISGKSPIILNKPGKFTQPGWTPPGPAGSKSHILQSPKSPNVIRRVGLSRNVRLTPLHPKVGIK